MLLSSNSSTQFCVACSKPHTMHANTLCSGIDCDAYIYCKCCIDGVNFGLLFHLLRGIFPISDKFRIVGLAEHAGGPQVDLLSDPEFVSMFLFHNVKPLDKEGEREVILNKVLCVCWQQLTPQSIPLHFIYLHS